MDLNGVKDLVQQYFDANYDQDSKKLERAFNEAAHIYGIQGGEVLSDMPRDEFIKFVSSMPHMEYPREDEILSIDFTGQYTAVARVKIRVGPTMFTDVLSLVNLNGVWSIIAKLYSGEAI